MAKAKATPAAAVTIETWPLDRPKPYAGNPRKISAEAVAKVAASIREFGGQQPIVVDRDGVIIAGHTRLQAARSLALESVPVLIASNLTPDQVAAYRIADNRTGEECEWDDGLLAKELAGLVLAGFELDLTGFDAAELDKLLDAETEEPKAAPGEIELPPASKYKEQYGVIVLCRDEQEQAGIYERLVKDGLNCKVVAT